MEEVCLMIRVKLPDSGSYHSSPSGDTEYEGDCYKALKDATPPGYQVLHPRGNESWPRDSEGFTWVRLKCVNEKVMSAHWMDTAQAYKRQLNRIREVLQKEFE